MKNDHHRILGVAPDASLATIKAAYRRLARRYHPDVSTEPDAGERFAEITAAYQALQAAHIVRENRHKVQNPAREMRGESAHAEPTPKPPPRADETSPAAPDCELAVHLSVEELYWGTELRIDPATQCPGRRTRNTPSRKLLNVRLARGAQPGQRLRLKSADRGAQPEHGAIYVTVHLKPHERYDVIDNTLYADLPLTPQEASNGAIVDVVTPGGRVEVDVPAGIGSGQSIRIPQRGLPTSPTEYGDMFAVARIVNMEERTRHLQRWPHVAHRDTKHWRPVGGYRSGAHIDVTA